MKKPCLLTFDYELFFKESGTPQACLLAPTYDLLTLLDKTGGKVTFFIDALYLRRLQEAREHAETYAWIESQIKTMVEKGHRIELHLHPHWLDATWNTSKESWDFPSLFRHQSYRFLPIRS